MITLSFFSGTFGFGRGMSPNMPYGGGFAPSNGFNTHGSPSQLKTSPNSAYSKTKQRTPVIQARGSPQPDVNVNRIAKGQVLPGQGQSIG